MNDALSRHYGLRRRAPRVDLEYEVEINGATRSVRLPWVTGVIADLCGRPEEPLPRLEDRRFVEFDIDNFDMRLRALKPRVAFRAPNMLTGEGQLVVDLIFEQMDDFDPRGIASRVEPLRWLLNERDTLEHLLALLDGKPRAVELLEKVLCDADLVRELADVPPLESDPFADLRGTSARPTAPTHPTRADFDLLLQRELRPTTDEALANAQMATRAFFRLCLQMSHVLVFGDALETIRELIAKLESTLSEQVEAIIRFPDFTSLEATWRGLHRLVCCSETGETLKIRVLNVSKRDLYTSLRKFAGTSWVGSPLCKAVYANEFDQLGGEPYGLVVVDYSFDHSPSDVQMLGLLAQVGKAALVPMVASAKPSLLQLERWTELSLPRDLSKIFEMNEYAAWRSLRESDVSSYLVLTLPGVLARLPHDTLRWGKAGRDSGGSQAPQAMRDDFVWSSAAYMLALAVHQAILEHGWPARIVGVDGGGTIDGLPWTSIVEDDGRVVPVGPTETDVSDARQAELARLGLMALVRRRTSDMASFLSAPTLHAPAVYDVEEATRTAALQARLPHRLVVNRIGVYLRCLERDTMSAQDLEPADVAERMNRWLARYVARDPLLGADTGHAGSPLADAEVEVNRGANGFLNTKLMVRPHYQLSTPPSALVLRLSLKGASEHTAEGLVEDEADES